jgi:hypothetical protein
MNFRHWAKYYKKLRGNVKKMRAIQKMKSIWQVDNVALAM